MSDLPVFKISDFPGVADAFASVRERFEEEFPELDLFLNIAFIPFGLLDKAPWNYKHDDKEAAKKLLEQIRKEGQIINCCVREKRSGRFEIVDGNHRYDIFKILGQGYVFAFDLRRKDGTPITKIEAKRLAPEINETKFKLDPLKFAPLAQELIGHFGLDELTRTMNFTGKELTGFAELTTFNWDQFDQGGSSSPSGWTTITLFMPDEAAAVFNRAVEVVSQTEQLDNRRSVKLGRVVELLSADFLAGSPSPTPVET